jgi:hypothetical protein
MSVMIPASVGSLAKCEICGTHHHWIGDHLAEVHDLTVEAYLALYPGAATCSAELVASYETASKKRRKVAEASGLAVNFAGVSFPVDSRVPASACLPMPSHYAIPKEGKLAKDIQDVIIAIKRHRSVWVWGAPGTGKDAVFSALCAMTRRPSLLFTIVQGADVTAWKFSRSFNAQGTSWEEGALLKALRDGYVTESGERIPYLIVLSDFDRATRQQAEELRQILDSIQGRISGPTGEIWPVLPGTVIVATANSSGAGDTTGRCISANPIDASILDRFERKIRFHAMDPRDEEPVIRAKFPVLAGKMPDAISCMMRATVAVREGVEKEEVYCEWSHRTLCAWAGAAEDIMETISGKHHLASLLKRAARVVLDGMPDADARENVKRIMDPHIKGGMVNEGDTAHIDRDGALVEW